MKGPHHDGKPNVSDVINSVLEGFKMNIFKQTVWERPQAHHLDGLDTPEGVVREDVRQEFHCQRNALWQRLIKNPPLNEDGSKASVEYSVDCDVHGTSLGQLAKSHLQSADDFSPMADSSHFYDPIDHE